MRERERENAGKETRIREKMEINKHINKDENSFERGARRKNSGWRK